MKASHLLHVLFALTCIAIPLPAHSDEINVYPISSTPRLILKGKIGDYPITMNLFLYPTTVYSNYSYQNKNSSLELIGTLNYDKVVLYEYANHHRRRDSLLLRNRPRNSLASQKIPALRFHKYTCRLKYDFKPGRSFGRGESAQCVTHTPHA